MFRAVRAQVFLLLNGGAHLQESADWNLLPLDPYGCSCAGDDAQIKYTFEGEFGGWELYSSRWIESMSFPRNLRI